MEIVLVRHGKPMLSTKQKLRAVEFPRWVTCYDESMVDSTSYPPKKLAKLARNAYVISSTLTRAVHSAELVTGKPVGQKFEQLNEMHIPNHKLPFHLSSLKLSVAYWLFINRILWMLGLSGEVESFKKAKKRAYLMAITLTKIAVENPSTLVFGHALMNRQICKELSKLGWQVNRSGSGYWSIITLTK